MLVVISSLNKWRQGFSLVEVMVAIVILMVGMLGLLQSINIAIEHDTRNQMRNEAVQVGEIVMNDFKARPFTDLSAVSQVSVPSALRGWSKTYVATRQVIPLPQGSTLATATSKQLDVTVAWSYKNISTHHQLVTIRSKE